MSPNIALRWLWPALVLLVGVLGMATIWAVVALVTRQPCAWLAVVAALDMALLLRLSGAPAGRWRRIAAVLGTAMTIAFSYWMVVATQMGQVVGLKPMASAWRLGPQLAWDLTLLNQNGWDLLWLLLALPLAAWWAGSGQRKAATP